MLFLVINMGAHYPHSTHRVCVCLCAVLQRPSVWVSTCCCFCIWLAAAVVPLGTNFFNLFWQIRTWTGGIFWKKKKPFSSVGYILKDDSFLDGVKIPPFLIKKNKCLWYLKGTQWISSGYHMDFWFGKALWPPHRHYGFQNVCWIH